MLCIENCVNHGKFRAVNNEIFRFLEIFGRYPNGRKNNNYENYCGLYRQHRKVFIDGVNVVDKPRALKRKLDMPDFWCLRYLKVTEY